LKRVEFTRRIRLLGVRVGSLVKASDVSLMPAAAEKGLSSAHVLQEPQPLKDTTHEQADLF
jgi:hypothetical protein